MSPLPTTALRPMRHADLDQVLAWRNHPAVRGHMFTAHEITRDEHIQWFDRVSRDPARELLIFEVDGQPRGFVNFHRTGPGGVADWGFYVAPDAPAGTGHALGRAALRHAFEEAGFHKVCGQALASNDRSIRFHLNLGFVREGTLRQQHFDGQQHVDVVCFGLLARDWHRHQYPE